MTSSEIWTREFGARRPFGRFRAMPAGRRGRLVVLAALAATGLVTLLAIGSSS